MQIFFLSGVKAESLLENLDMKGICVSSGSACTSGSLDASYVLLEMGLTEEEAKSSVRFTFGKYNTKEEIDYTVECLVEIVERLRGI